MIDGYTIRRFRDLKRAEIQNDLCHEILLKENIIDSIKTPKCDISSWEACFRSLAEHNENIIVEKECQSDGESKFVIGRVGKVYKHFAYLRHFDADGIWQHEPFKIAYNEITSVTFKSRYVQLFSKYVDGSYPAK